MPIQSAIPSNIIAALIEAFTANDIIATAAAGVFTFRYGDEVVDKYLPTHLMKAAHNLNAHVKERYAAELNGAFNMYRYFRDHPDLLSPSLRTLFSCGNKENSNINFSQLFQNQPRQLIFYGAPGTGKSFQTDKIAKLYDDTIRVTFHPDSDYASFVGCYKPSMTPVQRVNCIDDKAKLVKNADGTPSMTEAIVYKFVPQAFAKAYVKAWEKMAAADSPERIPLQFLVIEEINRGNCAQIFGDLFQLLDRDDYGFSKYPVDPDADLSRHLCAWFHGEYTNGDGTKSPNVVAGIDDATKAKKVASDSDATWDDILSGRKLVLPPNLYIWATMNTSDQSLFPIDSAFKRRWGWEYVPIADADKKWAVVANKKRFDWWAFLEKANDAVREATKSEDKELGYFFVKPPAGSTDIPAKTFVDKVLFYLFGDAFKDDVPPMSLFPKKKGDSKPWTLRDFRKNVLEGDSAKSLPNEEALAEWLEQIGIKAPDADETADTATASAATDEAATASATDEPAES